MTLLVDSIAWLIAKLPRRGRVWLGRTVAVVLRYVVRYRVATVRENLGFAFPELSARERGRLLNGVYRHLGLLIVEMAALPAMTPEQLAETCTFEGAEHYHAAMEKGRGTFFLSAHVGNWELGLARCTSLGYPSYAIVKEIKGALGQYAADKLRSGHGLHLIPRRQSLRAIRKALAENGAVGFVLDQNMTADEGVFVDFFNRPACTMTGLALLAQRYDIPVVPVSFYREDDGIHHRVVFQPEVAWETPCDNHSRNVRHNTQRYTTILEDVIRKHPEQWLWIHRRWRTTPPAGSEAPAPDTDT